MGVFDQADHAYRFDWGHTGVAALGPSAAALVIVDVLSFTTCVDVAVSAGAEVVPATTDEEAGLLLAQRRGTVVAARERSLAAPSLSPTSLRRLTPGTRLVLPSPNGATLAALATRTSNAVLFAACLRNARAVAVAAAAVARERNGPIAVVASGERWAGDAQQLRPCVEDLLGAGAVLAALDPAGSASSPGCSPEAAAARAAYVAARPRLAEAVTDSASGRELAQRGFADDVALACELDVSPLAPRLDRGAFVGR